MVTKEIKRLWAMAYNRGASKSRLVCKILAISALTITG